MELERKDIVESDSGSSAAKSAPLFEFPKEPKEGRRRPRFDGSNMSLPLGFKLRESSSDNSLTTRDDSDTSVEDTEVGAQTKGVYQSKDGSVVGERNENLPGYTAPKGSTPNPAGSVTSQHSIKMRNATPGGTPPWMKADIKKGELTDDARKTFRKLKVDIMTAET